MLFWPRVRTFADIDEVLFTLTKQLIKRVTVSSSMIGDVGILTKRIHSIIFREREREGGGNKRNKETRLSTLSFPLSTLFLPLIEYSFNEAKSTF